MIKEERKEILPHVKKDKHSHGQVMEIKLDRCVVQLKEFVMKMMMMMISRRKMMSRGSTKQGLSFI